MRLGAGLAGWCIAGMLAAAPSLRASSTGGLTLGPVGSITSDPAEVVSGARSIKGSYFGSNPYQPYLLSDPRLLPLQAGQTYQITFRYKILSANQGFDVIFYSPTGAAHNDWLPGQSVTGSPGDTGKFSLTNTLGSYSDYQALWTIHGTGSIAIDEIQIRNASTGAVLVSEDAETGTFLLSTFFVSASKLSFVWGEPVKVAATLYDETGKPSPPAPVTWTVTPPAAAVVAPDGTVTPNALQTFTVRGTSASGSGEVVMQALPKRIVVTPESQSMLVGATQKIRADVMDVNDKPIPKAAVQWSVSSQYFTFSNSATIDASGTLTGVLEARVRVVASIRYDQRVSEFDSVAQGDALVDIKAPTTYQFERIFVSRPSGAATSTLAPRAAPLIPTETGGFMFAASLDGLGRALLEWNNGTLTPVLGSGRVNPANGYPLADLVSYGRISSGDALVQEADTAGGVLVSRGPSGLVAPAFANGSAVFGAQNTYSFDITRNSLADSGALLIRVGYTDAVTHLGTQGLFRGFGRGISEPVINNRDSRVANGDTPGGFDSFGIANDGTAWFNSNTAFWRSRPGQPLERLLAAGDPLGSETINGILSNYGLIEPLLFVAGNGDVVSAVYTNKGQRLLLWHDGDTAPSAILQPGNAYGVYWYNPATGALLDAALPGKARGLYLWNQTGTKPLLLLNDPSPDGSAVQEIVSATSTNDGTIYVMMRTANNPMVIARLAPDPAVLLQAGDSVPVSVPPVIAALIPGPRKGVPLMIAGGQAGSIAQLNADGTITPIVAVGTRLPDGKYFAGSRADMARNLADGRIVFAHDYFASDSSLYTWNQGSIEVTVRAPLKHPDGTQIGSPRSLQVNQQGDVAFQLSWNGPGLYRLRNGNLTTAADGRGNLTVDGLTVQNPNLQGIDGAGNILFSGTKPDQTGFYLSMWDGNAAHVIMTPGQKMPDGRQVSSVGPGKGCADGFVVSALASLVRYRNGTWTYLADPSQPLADGASGIRTSITNYDANDQCDVVFLADPFSNGTQILGGRIGPQYQEIQDLQQLTPNGDLLRVTQTLINDDGTVYILGANYQGEEVLYRGTPLALLGGGGGGGGGGGAGGGGATIPPQPASGSRSPANGATYAAGGLVPGSWAQVQGTNLSDVTRIWTASDFTGLGNRLPTKLSGVEVTVNGIPAAVYYISPTQVNFQVPAGVSGTANVVVSHNGVAGKPVPADIVTSAPGIFPIAVGGKNYAAGVFLDGKFTGDPAINAAFRKARPGETIQLYATGLVPSPAGVVVSFQQVTGVTVKIGDITVPADAAGLVAVGQFQINFKVPAQFAGLPEGDYPISIQVNGVSSPATINTDPPGPVVIPIQH